MTIIEKWEAEAAEHRKLQHDEISWECGYADGIDAVLADLKNVTCGTCKWKKYSSYHEADQCTCFSSPACNRILHNVLSGCICHEKEEHENV